MENAKTFRIGSFTFEDTQENRAWEVVVIRDLNRLGLLRSKSWGIVKRKEKDINQYVTLIQQMFMPEILRKCYKNFLQAVCFDENKRFGMNIIKELNSYPRNEFMALKELYLRKNNIVSIQFLCNIDFKNLLQLNLYQNSISQLKSIRKVYIPKVRLIDLRKNPIFQPVSIEQLNCPDLREFKIHRFYQKGQTYHFYHKLQTNKIIDLTLSINPNLNKSHRLWRDAVLAIQNKNLLKLQKYYGWIQAKKKSRLEAQQLGNQIEVYQL